MLAGYSYVEGSDLAPFVLGVREEFFARLPHGPDDLHRPNSVRLVAIDMFEAKTSHEQLAIVRDLLVANAGLSLVRDEDQPIFEHSDTPADYLVDLVCEVVHQILARDPVVRSEDDRRLSIFLGSAEDLD